MMETAEYISHMKLFYTYFLKFIEADTDSLEDFNNFIIFIKNNNFVEYPEEFRSMLHIIHKISNHHKRQAFFVDKIHRILLYYSDKIKQTFSSSDIFRIFKNNKLILSFLFKHKIIAIDENIAYKLYDKYDQTDTNFFYSEIQPFLKENGGKISFTKNPKVLDSNFEKNCQIGENESQICQLIRDDSLDKFISFVKDQKLNLSSHIAESIFETHPFLIKKWSISIIEYAAFYGSVQIFEYLLKNKVHASSSLWNFAVHSKSIEMIHLLEKYKIKPENGSYETCFFESLKCHHNDIAHYIQSNLYKDSEKINLFNNYSNYYNFDFFQNELTGDIESIFDFACQNDYTIIVKILLKNNKIDLRGLLKKRSIF